MYRSSLRALVGLINVVVLGTFTLEHSVEPVQSSPVLPPARSAPHPESAEGRGKRGVGLSHFSLQVGWGRDRDHILPCAFLDRAEGRPG